MKTYRVNEIYRSRQGEGARTGADTLFVRFSGCNMQCRIEPGPLSPGGFDCDTEFASGSTVTAPELLAWAMMVDDAKGTRSKCRGVIFTGGEPALQLDQDLVSRFKVAGYFTAIETNGSIPVPEHLDYIAVSPKVAEHAIRQRVADEVRYVRGYRQALPKTVVVAKRYFISPAFNGEVTDEETVEWCKQLCEGTKWELSIQSHKVWNVR